MRAGQLFISLILFFVSVSLQAQQVELSGFVRDNDNKPVSFANIQVDGTGNGTTSDDEGRYSLSLTKNTKYLLILSRPGYNTEKLSISVGSVNLTRSFVLTANDLGVVNVESQRTGSMQRIDPKFTKFVPTPGGDFLNAVLSSQPGVSMRNELSSAYSVRGGSFDENVIYVNDIEIYRPFLVRAGQQEGLSFVNGDLVKNVNFSAGGFDAKYGDKMASVLDIQYRKPTEFGGSVTGGLMGGSAHLENVSKDGKTTYIAGIRYRSNSYILGSLDTKGDYRPRYTDFQTYITHKFSNRFDIGILGNYSANRYNFVPQTRETNLGSIQEALKFTVYFDGQELSRYHTGMGAVDLNYHITNDFKLKLILSQFYTREREEFDIVGQYQLDEIERDFGSDDFGDVVRNLGVGGFLNHARNRLTADVKSANVKGYLTVLNHYLQFGVGLQGEKFTDQLSEFTYIDSADYSAPNNTGGNLMVNEVIRAKNQLTSYRATAYVQDAYNYVNDSYDEFRLNVGVRANYWSYNNQTVISPRMTASFVPNWNRQINDSTTIKKSLTLRFSTGLYYQPPFYREMRGFTGSLNPDIVAQKSTHFVLGADYGLRLWKRPFKLVGETYYKLYDKLIPYELENVRLRYYATNNAKGFARGADFKLNGEFVPGIESWVSVSFLQTQEDLIDDYYVNYFNQSNTLIQPSTFDKVATDSVRYTPGYIPRPTDQRLSFGMFFQDEMPGFKGFKVNLNLIYGTGLPYGPPSHDRYRDTLRTPSYKRVDIGFMKELITPQKPAKGLFKNFKEAFISLEVFNLLQIQNTINYQWIKDVTGSTYSVPNYLTGRRVNLKFIVRF
ncbi:MAG: carboxypeptidase-like regulatory domain-containing protein [Bacteroidota bacterium]